LSKRQPAGREAGSGRSIPIDAPVDLSMVNPVNELRAGDLFGEMTCMNRYPRSATVRATTDCVMLEMLKNVLEIVQRNKTMRAQIESNYRNRALDDHLRTVPIFANLSQDFIDGLRAKVDLIRYAQGDVICRQNDIADSFYLVRVGFVITLKNILAEIWFWRTWPQLFWRNWFAGRRAAHGYRDGAGPRGSGPYRR
jgi:CRP-like cAMP-binding protein